MALVKIHKITAIIRLQSGLHIGAGKDAVEIGGLDNPIIKNPLTNAPYIPGSSLKGKMRSLLEAREMGNNPQMREFLLKGSPCQCGRRSCAVCMIFGVSAGGKGKDDDLGPTRILVRDALLTSEDKARFEKNELPMEIKYENTINRASGQANPRPLERVPAGVCFEANIALREYKGDPTNLMDTVFKCLKMVELDALGGSGSRGCGEIKFENIKVDDVHRFNNLDTLEI